MYIYICIHSYCIYIYNFQSGVVFATVFSGHLMKITRYNNNVFFEATLETFGVRRKILSQRVTGFRMRAPLNLERNIHARVHRCTERTACDLHREGSTFIGCWVTSMKQRTKIVATFFVRSSVYAPWSFASSFSLSASAPHPLAILVFSPRGLVDDDARPGFDRVEVVEDSYGDSAIDRRKPRRMLRIARGNRKAGKRSAQWPRRHRNVKQ